jgi:hypothetical protein
MRYEIDGAWYTPDELADMSGIAAHTIRDRLRRGFSIEEAIKVIPVRDSVRAFCDASYYKDWIGMSINALYEIYFKWCISQGYEYIEVSKQGFSRQLFSIYPNLKTVPTKCGEQSHRIIRERCLI